MLVNLLDVMGDDLSIVNAARVSFHKQSEWDWVEEGGIGLGSYQELHEKDQKLIRYLAKHKHFSPFNHAFLSFRVSAPIFVARQLVKHEYLVWNEVSRRYVENKPEFYMPAWRERAENVKQGSSDKLADAEEEDGMYAMLLNDATRLYDRLLNAGVCNEQARMVLPQSLMTEWVWSGSLKAFAKMCKLRLDPHSQKETQEVAKLISAYTEGYFPCSWKALLEAEIE